MKRLLPMLAASAAIFVSAEAVAQDNVMRCNGKTDFVSSKQLLSNTNEFTMEAWVLPAAPHEIDTEALSGYAGIEGQRYLIYPSHGTHCWGRGHAGAGISVGTNGVSVYEHAGDYIPALLVWQGSITGWTHIAVVYRDRVPFLYVNGELVRTGLRSPQAFVHPSSGEFARPRQNGPNSGGIGGGIYGYYQGELDDVRIWDMAQSPSEIRRSIRGVVDASSHLVANYDMNRSGHGAGLVVENVLAPGGSMLNGATFGTEQTPIFTPRDGRPQWSANEPVIATANGSGSVVHVGASIDPASLSESNQVENAPVTYRAEPPATAVATARGGVGARDAAAQTIAAPVVDEAGAVAGEKVAAKRSLVVTGMALQENRPNPFSGGTTIGYSIPAQGRVTIVITDANGRQLAKLIDGEHLAGTHEVSVAAELFESSGTYYYTMTWGGNQLTRSLVVVR